MTTTLSFLTSHDPPGTSKGTLDPLGLYQIAEKLAAQLVPVVRERMQRIRSVTAIELGTLTRRGRAVRAPPDVMNQKKSFDTAEPCQRGDWFLNTLGTLVFRPFDTN
jgi:hypothetical protein